MIIKIDHLAFCSLQFEEDLRCFKTWGYDVNFLERDLRDLENKKPFMKDFSGQLDMAFMMRPGSINIELLHHGHVTEGGAYILPILEGSNFEMERIEEPVFIADYSFVKVRSKFLKEEFYVLEEENPGSLLCNKMITVADDVARAAVLWTYLGFNAMAINEQWAHLKFKSLGGNGAVDLFIRKKNAGAQPFYLDRYGFNCLAFFSTDVEKEKKRFEKLKIETSEINRFRINGKDLHVFWLRGYWGEIIEIIGLA